MSEKNGESKLGLPPVLANIRQSLENAPEKSLPGEFAVRPGVARFLIGGAHDGGFWPAGDMWIRYNEGKVCVSLNLRDLEIEAKYTGPDVDSVLETIDNDLVTNTVAWVLDWKGRERERNKVRSLK